MARLQIAILAALALNAVLLGISVYTNFHLHSVYADILASQAETRKRMNELVQHPCTEGMTLQPGEGCEMDIPLLPMMPQPQIQAPPPGRPL